MILDRFKLTARVAIVTGAGRGIGKTCAIALSEVGAIVICVARTEDEVNATAAEITSRGGSASAIVADVTDVDDVRRLVGEVVDEHGRIDLLLNNAGGGGHGPTKNITEKQVQEAINLIFLAPIYLVRECAPHMRAAGGAVVNISSGYARVANIGSVVYGGAKAAQEQATRMLAMEYAPHIRINGIRVGAIQTDNMKTRLLDRQSDIGAKLSYWTPMQRMGEPEDIAAGVVYLLSDVSSFVTRKILDIDGGVVVKRSAMEIIQKADALLKENAAGEG